MPSSSWVSAVALVVIAALMFVAIVSDKAGF